MRCVHNVREIRKTWVEHQRHQYRLLKEGKASYMADDLMRKLESIGLRWVIKGQNYKSWDGRFQGKLRELQSSQDEQEDCNVPTALRALESWVKHQQQQYRCLKRETFIHD